MSCPVPLQDPQYIQQALTHVLLMDAVVSTLQTPGAIYAASKLSYFDKMKNESKKSMSLTSRVVLGCVLMFTGVTTTQETHNFSFFSLLCLDFDCRIVLCLSTQPVSS